MFLDMLPSANSFAFPLVTNVGSLKQTFTDKTTLILRFNGSDNAPGNSSLNVQQSIGGSGPWSVAYQNVYVLNGLPIADVLVEVPAPYYQNNYFRYRWENVTLGYVGPWQSLAGPTTKGAWNVSTFPIAPSSISSIVGGVVDTFTPYVDVEVIHSLNNSGNYSDTGMYITATAIFSGFSRTQGRYFASGWGASIGASSIYRVTFDYSSAGPVTATGASAQYYVLGDPVPGILGSIVNY